MPLSFRELQARLDPSWAENHEGDQADFDQLVVPSLSFEAEQLRLIRGGHHYEERQLFSLIRLRHPRVRAIYVTSKLLPDLVVDAVLELLPGVPASHARRRLQLFDTDDASSRPLTAKLLERPALLRRLADQLRPGRSFMTCLTVTPLERELSERLQVPLLGNDPDLRHWGSKAGSRELLAGCGVPHPPGSVLVHTVDDLAEAMAELWEQQPGLRRCVVKLNEGFSGEGNALLPLEPLNLTDSSGPERRQRLRQALEQLAMPALSWREQLSRQGAVVEAWLEGGDACTSPSVQGTIHPGGRVEVLSTHEQILGGPTGQTYKGCRFPAAEPYRAALQAIGQAVGEALAARGCLERYAVDVLARRFGDQWDLQALEINLRQGGTTHPYLVLRTISRGRLDGSCGLFRSPMGQPLHYEATDNFEDDRLRGLLPIDLIDIVAEAGLHFDPTVMRGTVFHLLGCLSEFGKVGMTCIGGSEAEAAAVYAATAAQLHTLAKRLQER